MIFENLFFVDLTSLDIAKYNIKIRCGNLLDLRHLRFIR